MATKKTTTRKYARAPTRPKYAPTRPLPNYYRGNGDYFKAPKAIRPAKKTTSSLGGAIGAHLGHGLHTVIKALTGFGDYEVTNNSLMPQTLGGDPPIIKNTRNNSHIVHHREYIGDVYAATAFTVTSYPINPGLLSTFPWVSQQADSYEQYKFRGLVFEFKSMSSDAVLSSASSSALGTVVMSTQYNALDTGFTDKRTMENYEFANSSKPSCSFLHPIECKQSQTTVSELYVRTGAVATGDLRLYDLGTFSIAVQGMQNAASNQVIGELWCSYELEFFKPKLLVGGGALLSDHYYGNGTNVFTSGSPLGPQGTLVKSSGSNIGTTLQIASINPYGGNSIIFPAYITDGLFLITYFFGGAVASTNAPQYNPIGTTVNIDVVSSQVKIFGGNLNSYNLSPSPGETSLETAFQQCLRIIQTSPGIPAGIQISFPAGVFATGAQKVDLTIVQLAPSIN